MGLNELKVGQKGIITGFLDNEISLQLLEMGCIPGEIVELVNIAPLGDPIAINVSGYKLSLRKNEAKYIHVKLLTSETSIVL